MYKEGKLSEFISHWTDKNMLSSRIDALRLAQYLIILKKKSNAKDSINVLVLKVKHVDGKSKIISQSYDD